RQKLFSFLFTEDTQFLPCIRGAPYIFSFSLYNLFFQKRKKHSELLFSPFSSIKKVEKFGLCLLVYVTLIGRFTGIVS
uniref:Uncharacterized protein n=1 Tax=Solanum lycopersicum TaxID=4081 RepID=A0A3Q7J2N1_SOLLC